MEQFLPSKIPDNFIIVVAYFTKHSTKGILNILWIILSDTAIQDNAYTKGYLKHWKVCLWVGGYLTFCSNSFQISSQLTFLID